MGLYRHTDSLVIAAPMAHYVALTGSRYRFSQQLDYLPIRSLSKILRGEACNMYMTTIGGIKERKQVPFCRALNYLFRPEELEDMSPYEFFTKIEVMPMNKISPNCEYFTFSDEHPKKAQSFCVYRKLETVPNLDWTFFGDAKQLPFSILSRKQDTSDTIEEYSRRYLLCFTAFRTEKDLLYRGTYQRRIRQAHESGELDPHIRIMQNIQNIRNSLDAGRMMDDLPTLEIDPDDSQMIESSRPEDDYTNLIATYFAKTSNTVILKEEPVVFEFPETSFSTSEIDHGDIWSNGPRNVLVSGNKPKPPKPHVFGKTREITTLQSLNYVLQSSFLMHQEGITNNEQVIANGTVESIIAFGLSRNFDLDQQTAFEILTATYILTYVEDVFYEYKDGNKDNPSIEFQQLSECRDLLKSLAQVDKRKKEPLRMFLTGPAGAGKCT